MNVFSSPANQIVKQISRDILRTYAKEIRPAASVCHDSPTFFPSRTNQVVCPWNEANGEELDTNGRKSSSHSYERWRKLTLWVCLPTIAIFSIATFGFSSRKHERLEYVPYEYLTIRKTPFPWGDGNRSLFHTKRVNALPGGYEDGDDDKI